MGWTALEQDFVTVTERTALAAGQTMGYGDALHSEGVAAQTMHSALEETDFTGRVVIGKDRAEDRRLHVGEALGSAADSPAEQQVDLAVGPLEGIRLCASGGSGAISALAAAEPGGLLGAPDVLMEKIVVGPTARGHIHLDAPVPENLRNIAAAFGREVSDLTVTILARDRHTQLIADVRQAGARIRLISDGDLSSAIAVAVRGTGIHAVMGTGGSPEGVLAAAAMRCLGGEIQARILPRDDDERQRLADAGFPDAERIFQTEDLARGEQILFSCTGVTQGELLRGVRFFGGGARTSTLAMSLARRIVRFVDTIHRDDISGPIYFR